MQPQRIMTIEAIPLGNGVEIQPWTYAWKLGEDPGGMITIEYQGREYRIPAKSTCQTPVPPPSATRLAALDPCFAEIGTNFVEIYRDEGRLFTVHRCPHGNHFLEDTRGGIGMFTLWIFLGPLPGQNQGRFQEAWRKFHHLPPDVIYHLAIGR